MLVRRVIEVEGTVQGVGFRPYVHRLATARQLHGSVRNDAARVIIDIEGELAPITAFCHDLTVAPPPLSTIARLHVAPAAPMRRTAFRILPSAHEPGVLGVSAVPPDVATCDACVDELFDPANRRYGHAFIACTDCGPRYTGVFGVPYDRERTHMAPYAMCAVCRAEYDNASNRRFHAESIACPDCGPVLVARRTNGTITHDAHGSTAVARAAATIRAGGIVAVKALGGFHLACSATDSVAVERLRMRKHRLAKPFAVMVRDVASAQALCEISQVELTALTSSARPVVLLVARAHSHIAASVAPHVGTLGVMLPSTPLHHLLLAAVDGPVVMTSGNRSDEPVIITDGEADRALGDVADLFLTHDRAIAARCDDSVVRAIDGAVRTVRRARGYAPDTVTLPFPAPVCVLAVGGHLKNTVCVAYGRFAHLSAHLGDLGSHAARKAQRMAIDGISRLVGVTPSVIAHDVHPEYASTHLAEVLALEIAAREGTIQRVAVQHHHAHVAACVAEYGIRQPVIGVVFDGAGLGTDGAIWGGEFLIVDGARFSRRGHLAYVPLPGGDAAARTPWRSAAAHVSRAGLSNAAAARARPTSIGTSDWRLVQQILSGTAHAPLTSSVGRLFDAVASLTGVCHVSRFEGEAAMALEAVAGSRDASAYPVHLSNDDCFTVSSESIIAAVLQDATRGRSVADIAAAFHASLTDLIVLGAERIRESTGITTVVLSGGVFANARLSATTEIALRHRKFRVCTPQRVPCNDGGLALGQAYVAACALQEEPCA